MRKILLLLLLSPLTYAEVYTFACKVDGTDSLTSIIIDTDRKYIQLGSSTMFNRAFINADSSVHAFYGDTGNLFTFNKITGQASQVWDYAKKLDPIYYTCKRAEPLMP